jgi:hypothetical protein
MDDPGFPNDPTFGTDPTLGSDPSSLTSVVPVLMVVILVVGIIVAIVNAMRVVQRGHNPLTLQTDLQLQALDSEVLAPSQSLEVRLAEVDALLAKGAISESEHATARAAILAG